MQEQAFATVEYDQLRGLVRGWTQTPMGRARVEALVPVASFDELQLALTAVTEAVRLKRQGLGWQFNELIDPTESIARLRVEGSILEPSSLLQLARLCEQLMTARASILAERETSPVLNQIVAALPRELNSVAARISNKILPSGELDDRASPELARIRHEIARLRSSITRTLENLMRRSEEAIQDELVTVRNDRFVVPVRADHRGRVQGVAHGFSSSGATVFVEPLETINSNNELQALREEEEREITRILLGLAEELRVHLPGIEMAARAVAELDFINAKAIFHEAFNCVVPEIGRVEVNAPGEARCTLRLSDARHPLLEATLRATGGTVVPVSFSLDNEQNAMVISGANAGGKTVVLKTAGLLSLMALSGLPVPAREAQVPFYTSVLADIGDHQSLAANLSTFTSHVANISRMIEVCRAPALVLLDEVGTGTDPEEGSALGVAVVDHFRKICGAHVMATTHYAGLKMYAANDPGVLNASVEFDEKTLRPTYHLIVGVAGSSSGLEIARRFGIPDQIIGSASNLVKDSSLQASEYLRHIKRDAEEAAALRQALEEERVAVAEKFASLDRESQKRERERQATFEGALAKSVSEFEKRSRELVSHIQNRTERLKVEREAQKRAAELKREMARAVTASRSVIVASGEVSGSRAVRVVRDGQVLQASAKPDDRAAPEQEETSEEQYIEAETRDIAVGDRVRLRSFGTIGIVDSIKEDEAEVRVKSLRFREKLDNLQLVESTGPAKAQVSRFAKLRASNVAETGFQGNTERVNSELNVIGQTTDEAVDRVDKFLDEAFMNSLNEIRIVHGHGTGALRKAIAEFLKNHPHVERFLTAPPEHGGAGATLVELKR